MTARPWTEPSTEPDGTARVVPKRACPCGLRLGDATRDELAAWAHRQELPDVRDECPICTLVGRPTDPPPRDLP